jgi:hypothetical protein
VPASGLWGAFIRFTPLSRAFRFGSESGLCRSRRSSRETLGTAPIEAGLEIDRRAPSPRPCEPSSGAGRGATRHRRFGGSPPTLDPAPIWETPGQRPDLDKCTLQGRAPHEARINLLADYRGGGRCHHRVAQFLAGALVGVRSDEDIVRNLPWRRPRGRMEEGGTK